MKWLFLFAYTCSGFAGLVYQVCWTRLLTLYIGHGTAAASAVVAAFLGGLAVGAAGGGAVVSRLTARQSLITYAALEIGVVAAALIIPVELRALTPALAYAYSDGAPGVLFPVIRLLSCLLLIFVPALALGATFPLAIRWFASDSGSRARASSALYALNTTGAAVGAVLAGFVLIPRLGVWGTTLVGVAGSIVAAGSVLLLLRVERDGIGVVSVARTTLGPVRVGRYKRLIPSRKLLADTTEVPRTAKRARKATMPAVAVTGAPWLAAAVLGFSGFAALLHEIAWTRILTLVLGPTTYAFAATLAAVISGVAIGSGIGTWAVARTRQPALWLSVALLGGAVTAVLTYSFAGGPVPRLVAKHMAAAPDTFEQLLWQGGLLTTALILPTAACLGAAFPLAMAMADDSSESAAGLFGRVYAVNTLGAVLGSLAAGFILIPAFGLETTLKIVSACLIAAALLVLFVAVLSKAARVGGILASGAAALMMLFTPTWDRELLASGIYMYAPYVPEGLDVDALLKAGSLLYYREGAAGTVSVKRLTGTTTLAVDGKTDASNRGDMLTQTLVAHLPLLLHDAPRTVAIIGLGSGVTVGSALTHPVGQVDVLEISPEVVEASAHFEQENHSALADPRTNLIVGDGRSHLRLSRRQYDVIISEPSNPWIAGVAALFTREFFQSARDRLAPGGIICQWANVYNISDRDLRSIVATFQSVFPYATAWLVGRDDVLLIASDEPLDQRLRNISLHWSRSGVAADLRDVAVVEPFSLWSLFVAGPPELRRYGAGTQILTDDRMTLEFSAPRELHGRSAGENGAALTALLGPEGGPHVIRRARTSATARQWRHRGVMMSARDAHSDAYDDYVKALTLDAADGDALEGLVRTAAITNRGSDALSWIKTLMAGRTPTAGVLVARSKLLASIDAKEDALMTAREAALMQPPSITALEQLASLYADAGQTTPLDGVVGQLRELAPRGAATGYYAAVASFLRGDAEQAVRHAESAIAIDRKYAAVYDLIGAAFTTLGQADRARDAFMTSLRFNAHDSTAYANLGVLELRAGNYEAASDYFAEALWLEPDSPMAREGLNASLLPRRR